MSSSIRWLTWGLLLVPVGLVAGAYAIPVLALIALFMAGLYAGVWVIARPREFVLSGATLIIVFPAWRRTIPLADIHTASVLSPTAFRSRYGLTLRIGAGGLWGGFGWLWSLRAGLIEFYISRTDGFLVLERTRGRTLLITPQDTDDLATEVRRRREHIALGDPPPSNAD